MIQMRIGIKIKHLLSILALIILITIYIVPKMTFIRAEELKNTDIEGAKVLYKRYITMVPFGEKRVKALFTLAEAILPKDRIEGEYIKVVGGFGQSTLGVTADVMNNAIRYYEEIYNKYSHDDYGYKSYVKLIQIYTNYGEIEKAKALIGEGLISSNNSIKKAATKYKILYLVVDRRYDEAERLINDYIKAWSIDADLFNMYGDIEFFKENYDKALEIYEKGDKDRIAHLDISDFDNTEYEDKKIFTYTKANVGGGNFVYKKYWAEQYKKIYNGAGDIHGKVIINGKPVAFARVYMKDSRFHKINEFSTDEDAISFWTDFNGEYQIKSLPEGEYTIGLVLPLMLIGKEPTVYKQDRVETMEWIKLKRDEKKEINFNFVKPFNVIEPKGEIEAKDGIVKVGWDQVQGAAYYRIGLIFNSSSVKGGSISGWGATADMIYGTEYTMNTEKVNNQGRAYGMGGDGLVDPKGYLGYFYPSSKTGVYVEAYDSNDRIINSTKPIQGDLEDFPGIIIPGELGEGDKLVLEKRPEEAIKVYEKNIYENPKDIHSMKVLYSIYSIGTRVKFGNGTGKPIHEGQNIDRAKKLGKRIYELTGEERYIEDIKH
jgi:tetratricopeptide (TPR) repeat protein